MPSTFFIFFSLSTDHSFLTLQERENCKKWSLKLNDDDDSDDYFFPQKKRNDENVLLKWNALTIKFFSLLLFLCHTHVAFNYALSYGRSMELVDDAMYFFSRMIGVCFIYLFNEKLVILSIFLLKFTGIFGRIATLYDLEAAHLCTFWGFLCWSCWILLNFGWKCRWVKNKICVNFKLWSIQIN